MESSLVTKALTHALETRSPGPGLIFHSDRGSQYASGSFRKLLAKHKLKQSMSRRGDCNDNAVAESFFHTLKIDVIHRNEYRS